MSFCWLGNNEYCGYSSDKEKEFKKFRKITQAAWEVVAFQKPNKLAHDIDDLCCFKLKDTNRIRLLEKVRDGCWWKKDWRTSWTDYETVHYPDCEGQIKSPTVECNFFLQCKEPNCFHFAKDDFCKICGATSSRYPCNHRKYTAFKWDKAYIFHSGKQICSAKPKADTVSNYVENVLKINPTATLASIQITAVISVIRQRKSWNNIMATTKNVNSRRLTSDEKKKQRKTIGPQGYGFDAVISLKRFTDKKYPLLLYEISENT